MRLPWREWGPLRNCMDDILMTNLAFCGGLNDVVVRVAELERGSTSLTCRERYSILGPGEFLFGALRVGHVPARISNEAQHIIGPPFI
jgi:hypothetical protein